MGSRFKGSIEPGAMPALHRYFGTPLTIFLLNLIYGTRFSDIHCGMRGITLDALTAMSIRSQSWEYASEMVVKSVRMKLVSGDADCTYDFRRIGPFLERFREGHAFIMGSRFQGSIEPGAMPALHRYFGTPLTNFLRMWGWGACWRRQS